MGRLSHATSINHKHKKHLSLHALFQGCGHGSYLFALGMPSIPFTENQELNIFLAIVALAIPVLGIARKRHWF